MSDNIDKILNGFANKSLSYKDYLILAGINEGNLGTFTAYLKFKEMSNLTATDIIKYQDELKNPRKLFSQSNTSNSSDSYTCSSTFSSRNTPLLKYAYKVQEYCTDNPSDRACICINNTLLQNEQEEIEYKENQMKYCEWETLDRQHEREYQNRISDYNKRSEKLEKELNEWRVAMVRGYYGGLSNAYPEGYGYQDWSKYLAIHVRSVWGLTHDWDVIYTSSYKEEELERFYYENHPDIVSPRVKFEKPIITKRMSVSQCCTNSIFAESATVEDILQSCS